MGLGGCEALGIILSLVGTALLLTAQLLAPWKTVGDDWIGIWRNCNVGRLDQCGGFTDWLEQIDITAARGCFIAADVLFFISLILMLFAICVDKKGGLITAKGGLEITAGIIILAGCGAFTALNLVDLSAISDLGLFGLTQRKEFGYAFYLGWASGGVVFISGICLAVGGNQRSKVLTFKRLIIFKCFRYLSVCWISFEA
ncbi:claudin-18-like [Ciona intestinalis]